MSMRSPKLLIALITTEGGMADLNSFDKSKLEKLFGMGSGYVLNFSDRTFREFFLDHRVDIDDPKYKKFGPSKANRMRSFWAIEPNWLLGKVITGLIERGAQEKAFGDSNPLLVDECRQIAQRLLSDQPVAELDALTAIADERDFEVVAEYVRDAIEKNQPEAALDRLHTFVHKFIRVICEPHGVEPNRDKPLHSIFGEYVKKLKDAGHLDSLMTERILKTSISVLESFNDVRNNKSLAHDNPILNYEESLLIFNHVAASVRFIKSLETKIKVNQVQQKKVSLFA